MAKIKLNVKNTQIAEALSKLKRPIVPKKKLEEIPVPLSAEPVLSEKTIIAEKEVLEVTLPPPKEISPPLEASVVKHAIPSETKVISPTPEKKEEVPVPSPKVEIPKLTEEEKTKKGITTGIEPLAEDGSSIKKPAFRDFKTVKKIEKKSFDARDRQGLRSSDDEGWRKFRSSHKLQKREIKEDVIIRPTSLKVKIPISIKDLASEMKLKSSELIAKLFRQSIVMTLNDLLDDETVIQLLGHDFGCEISIDTSEADRLRVTNKSIKEEIAETTTSDSVLRPPIITFMGHVDHGKTSLIDCIRKSNVASQEAGAITQHIGAFTTQTPSGLITILDTPGHEAFSSMRARGANVTDIVVLVIAGDEGIKTQTEEAIRQAKEAQVPILVAINKSDRPDFDPEKVYRQLSDHELLPEAWGGTTITVNCSATSGKGINELLEMLALQSEILELRANQNTRARGTILESEMHKGIGITATVLVQNGTLRVGDAIVFGDQWGRIKSMYDQFNHIVKEAGPSVAVKITGLSGLADAGNTFITVKNEKEARELAHDRLEGQKRHILQTSKKGSLETLLQLKKDDAPKKILRLLLKADVQGSLEALKNSLSKIQSNKILLEIIHSAVGEICESDVQLAAASKGVILGFHTHVEYHAESLIKELKVDVRLHDIIYHAIDDVKALMKALLDKIPEEHEMGEATIKTIFKSSQLGKIAGCIVTSGIIKRNHFVRLLRKSEIIWKGKISSLKRVKDDVKEVSKGIECGIVLDNFSDFQEEDQIQSYEITYIEQEI
ncbi:MAG: translation initiation factor IF-2 [Chlamydiota bacterium]